MDRREFTKVMGAVAAGMLAGSKAFGDEKAAAGKTEAKADAKKAEAHVCKGHNACKGQGADGKNACKGKGSCASAAANNKCAGKNACKGKGGCAVPVNAEHLPKDKAGKSSCKGKRGCKGR